jgi:hypothetical protein
MKDKLKEKIIGFHNDLQDRGTIFSIISDTGSINDGWVSCTFSCPKKDVPSLLLGIRAEHNSGYRPK